MSEQPAFPARLVVLVALLLSVPTLLHVLAGELSVATAALRFGLALVVGSLAVQVVLAAVPRRRPAAEEQADEPVEPAVPARRAADLVDDEPAQAA